MDKSFYALTKTEQEILKQTPIWVALLMANADEDISLSELNDALRLVSYRRVKAPVKMLPFYELIGDEFGSKFNEAYKLLPNTFEERKELLSENLSKVNDVLPKLTPSFAKAFYKDMRSFAKHIANSSGGFLGMLSINKEEQALLDLPMIQAPMLSLDS